MSSRFESLFFPTSKALINHFNLFLNDSSSNELLITTKWINKFTDELPLKNTVKYNNWLKSNNKRRIKNVKFSKGELEDAVMKNFFEGS